MADVMWQRFETMDVGIPPDDWIEFSGRPIEYSIQDKRRAIARDFVSLASGGTADDVVAFARRWGPLRMPDFIDLDDAIAVLRNGWPRARVVDGIGTTLWLARFMARLYRDAEAADGPQRSRAEGTLVELVREAGLDFAPGGGLIPQLVPKDLIQVVAIALLEDVRSVGPVLQCLNYPSPGCLREVPPREGDEQRGRRRLYCSERCADRARSKRKYARRRAEKESMS